MTEDWIITKKKNLKFKSPVFIEGLPGLGNVGKIVADFMVEELKATKVVDVFSYTLPNSVFVNEENLVDLPKIEIYHKKLGKQDFLFLTGDIQPTDEYSSYTFCETILDLCEEFKCKEILTLSGIGLEDVPEKPKVYCTGNNKKFIESFKEFKANTKVYGRVGPIIGVSGLLVGLSAKRNIKSVALLAETFGHPMYIGIKGAKSLLNLLNKKYGFDLSLRKINRDIRKIDEEDGKDRKAQAGQFLQSKDASYIG